MNKEEAAERIMNDIIYDKKQEKIEKIAAGITELLFMTFRAIMCYLLCETAKVPVIVAVIVFFVWTKLHAIYRVLMCIAKNQGAKPWHY